MALDGLTDHADALRLQTEFLSEKKSLQEKIAAIEQRPDGWLERFREWILKAQRVGEIAETPVLTKRATTAKEIFGSNLVLEAKKQRGVAENQWALIPQFAQGDTCVRLLGFEPRTLEV